MFFGSCFFAFPIGYAIDEKLQGLFRTLLTGHFVKITLGDDPIVAVNERSDEIGADHFLVKLFAAATKVGVQYLVFVEIVGAHFSDGLFEHVVPFLFFLRPSLTFRADRAAWPY